MKEGKFKLTAKQWIILLSALYLAVLITSVGAAYRIGLNTDRSGDDGEQTDQPADIIIAQEPADDPLQALHVLTMEELLDPENALPEGDQIQITAGVVEVQRRAMTGSPSLNLFTIGADGQTVECYMRSLNEIAAEGDTVTVLGVLRRRPVAGAADELYLDDCILLRFMAVQ